MISTSNNSPSRNIERIFLLIITVVLGLLFYQLFDVLKRDFKEVPLRLSEGTMMNINDSNPGQKINTLLTRGFYFKDKADINLVNEIINNNQNKDADIDNVGELNKSRYSINADAAFTKGGESFKKRVLVSRALLGFAEGDSSLFEQERNAPIKLPPVITAGLGPHKISGSIKNNEQGVAG